MKKKRIIVGARGSLLSAAQTAGVIAQLKAKSPGFEFVFRKIITLGDTAKKWQRSDTGIFVKELEDALLSGRIDLAVHSVKDLPSRIPPDLSLAAVLKREEAQDILITKGQNKGLFKLKPGAVVGTCSLRRRAQILSVRPDLKIENLRGNLDTRIRKLNAGLYDAIIVAAAGVKRLGYKDLAAWKVSENSLLPAAGQGALGIEIRKGDSRIEKLVTKLNDVKTNSCVAAERSFLARTGAGCRMPVAAFARVKLNKIILEGMIISLDGTKIARASLEGKLSDAEIIGSLLAEMVLKNGGEDILREIKNGSC